MRRALLYGGAGGRIPPPLGGPPTPAGASGWNTGVAERGIASLSARARSALLPPVKLFVQCVPLCHRDTPSASPGRCCHPRRYCTASSLGTVPVGAGPTG